MREIDFMFGHKAALFSLIVLVALPMASDEFLATQSAQKLQRLAGKVLEMIE